MEVTVRFFALYRERAGASERVWSLPEGATLADLLAGIREAHPGLAPPEVEIVAAVNEEYAEGGVVLREGDEVALIPPVSGGAAVGIHAHTFERLREGFDRLPNVPSTPLESPPSLQQAQGRLDLPPSRRDLHNSPFSLTATQDTLTPSTDSGQAQSSPRAGEEGRGEGKGNLDD